MLCFASSTAISPKKKVPHETPDYRIARGQSLCCRSDPRWHLPCSCTNGEVSATGAKALLHAGSSRPSAGAVCRSHRFESYLLQSEGALEAELVPAGFWLRRR